MIMYLEQYFESKIEVPLIRHGKKQRIETLINEEALLLAKYLRGEKKKWRPRLALLNNTESGIINNKLDCNDA